MEAMVKGTKQKKKNKATVRRWKLWLEERNKRRIKLRLEN